MILFKLFDRFQILFKFVDRFQIRTITQYQYKRIGAINHIVYTIVA